MRQREVARFRTMLGMVFQQFNLFPHLTVLGNIIEAPRGVLGRARSELTDEAMDLLAKVNLAEKAKMYPARALGRSAAACRHCSLADHAPQDHAV